MERCDKCNSEVTEYKTNTWVCYTCGNSKTTHKTTSVHVEANEQRNVVTITSSRSFTINELHRIANFIKQFEHGK